MSSSRPRADITVAVSTVHRPARLGRCITELFNGHMLPREIVIIDQSDDSATADLVRSRQSDQIVPVRYIRQRTRGLAVSRNLAIAHATSRIVAFTDDDCVPAADWLAQIAGAFDGRARPRAVTGRILPLGPERPGFYAVSSRPSIVRRICRRRTLPWAVGSGGNMAVEREWLVRLGGFDEGLGAGSPGKAAEDTDMLYRLLLAGATVQYEPSAVVFHERQDRAHRLASRPSYGFGIGAFCAKWARQAHAYAAWMLACWVSERVRELLASVLRLRTQRIREELMMLLGAARGVAYGVVFAPMERGKRKCQYDLSPDNSSSV